VRNQSQRELGAGTGDEAKRDRYEAKLDEDDREHYLAWVARQQDLPLDRLVLDVDRENGRARAFYERHGFDHWGEVVARQLSARVWPAGDRREVIDEQGGHPWRGSLVGHGAVSRFVGPRLDPDRTGPRCDSRSSVRA